MSKNRNSKFISLKILGFPIQIERGNGFIFDAKNPNLYKIFLTNDKPKYRIKFGRNSLFFPKEAIIFSNNVYAIARNSDTEYVFFKNLNAVLRRNLKSNHRKFDVDLSGHVSSNTTLQILNFIFIIIASENSLFCLHACGVIYKGGSFIFVGPSESGKTTIAKLFKQIKAKVISDDFVILKEKKGKIYSLTLPWYNRTVENSINGARSPLRAIFFLKKSHLTSFTGLNKINALFKCAKNSVFPFYLGDKRKNYLALLDVLVDTVGCYDLKFSRNINIENLVDKVFKK